MIQDIIERLQTINQANGFFVNVTDVKEADSLDGLRPRGVAVSADGDACRISINAETTTLSQLQLDITTVLADSYYTIRDGDALLITPIIKSKRKRTQHTQESDDAVTETT